MSRLCKGTELSSIQHQCSDTTAPFELFSTA